MKYFYFYKITNNIKDLEKYVQDGWTPGKKLQ